ncbi:nickel pincer cofactor biosynthesis protein LarB [Tengunoibacter tsumagoiensis]|uniref:PurE domain-containing protein n=1 Tax=Tengunoibacter tsumagoiensis TaxID=2014871 RepID=A0A402A3C2_9CHLR|nr:nickel pincer cofactor biosynthesis protein LarB [Tengunoibacter tsumagoiensis]GCE13539.1 hypothetical protein KTT_33980 [Tengunoibacter tsumagoiensis]
MNHKSDEQIELISQLLGEGPFGQKQQHEQAERVGGSERFISSALPELQTESSFVIETRPDTGREERKGAPEIIYGAGKETAQVIAMANSLLAATGRAIISRVRPEAIEPLREAFQGNTVRIREASRAIVITKPDYVRKRTEGQVGVISAGTSDIPAADEAALIAEEMGCRVSCIYDVGVAGLHRLFKPLQAMLHEGVDVIIVAAGMDGALPSVIAGLVPVPVIGLPTSIGYGFGGNGVAALLSMLQTCAPGLAVVNIDNGVGAGITAALIANRVAQAREHQSQ